MNYIKEVKSFRRVQKSAKDQWLLFYPETDEKVVDTWVKSLRNVAQDTCWQHKFSF